MLIGVPKETKTGEYRVSLTDNSVFKLVQLGNKVILESEAGLGVGISDDQYIAAGASVTKSSRDIFEQAELIVKVKEPSLIECSQLNRGQTIFCYLHLAALPEQANLLCNSGATAIAFETVVGTDGQLPLLKPMSQIAGRLAVQSDAYYLQRHLGGRGILLGGIEGEDSGKVVIFGGGSAGESAAQIAIGMGAEVVIFDTSATRIEQLLERYGGTAECLIPTKDNFNEHVFDAEIIVGSVLIPGASAPKLITRKMIASMKEGVVLVDIAIDQGGCFETSRPTSHDDPVYAVEDVLHYCVANIPSAVPRTSTSALNDAILPYIKLLVEDGTESVVENRNHPLHSGINVHQGVITYPAVAEALA